MYAKAIKQFLIVCFVFSHVYFFGQSSHLKDSLLIFAKTAPEDSNKANALIELSHQLVQYNIEQAEIYAKQARSLSQKAKFSSGEAQALLALSRIDREKSNYSEALTNTFGALRIFEENNNTRGSANCYYELGYIYKFLTQYQKSIDFFSKALTLYKSDGNEKNAAMCETVLGHVNTDIAFNKKDSLHYKKARTHYTNVLNYYIKIKNQERISVALINLANLYLNYNSTFPSKKRLEQSKAYS